MPTTTAAATAADTTGRSANRLSVGDRLRSAATLWARGQHELVVLAVELADCGDWLLDGSPTAAHWIAEVADIEVCTAREWIRIGRRLVDLPAIALTVPAGHLARALAGWLGHNSNPEDLAAHHQRQRSITSRIEPDAMTTFTCRLPPLAAGRFAAALDATVMSNRVTAERAQDASADAWPTSHQSRFCEHSSTTPNANRSTHHRVAVTPPPARNEWSENATGPVSTAAPPTSSNTTTTRPNNKPTTPSPTNSNSAAPPATAADTATVTST